MRGNRCCGCLQRKLTRPQQTPPGARLTASWRQAVWGLWRPGIHGGRRTRRRPATPVCREADVPAPGCAWWQGQAGPRRRPEGAKKALSQACGRRGLLLSPATAWLPLGACAGPSLPCRPVRLRPPAAERPVRGGFTAWFCHARSACPWFRHPRDMESVLSLWSRGWQ